MSTQYKRISGWSARTVVGLSISALLLSSTSHADPLPFFDTIPGGRAYFDQRVNDASGTLYTHALSGLADNTNSWALPDFTITATNGNSRTVSPNNLNNFTGTLTGVPGGDAINMSASTIQGAGAGLTFTFNNPINGFGLDLDDWATCCFPSGLYISFDGGAPILVGSAASGADNPGQADDYRTFVGAIDDAGTFTTITFYGTGDGDALYAGGIIRYAIVPLGSISGNFVNTAQVTSVKGLASHFKDNEQPGPRQTVSEHLNTLNKSQVVQALKTIYPVNTSVTSQTMLSSSGQTSNVLIEKVGTVLGSTMSAPVMGFSGDNMNVSNWLFGDAPASNEGSFSGDPVMALASSSYKKFTMGEQAVWVQGVGAIADGEATDETLGYDTLSRGFVSGYETALDENHLIGVLASYFWSDIELDGDAGDTKADNYNLGIYGQKLIDQTKLTAVVSGGYGAYESQRRIDVGGVTATPEADYEGYSASASLSASHLFTHGTVKVEPFVQATYTHVWTNGYQETGGGAFNMDVSDDQFSTVGAKIGVNLQDEYTVADRKLTLDIKPYIGHQWELQGASNETSLVGANNTTTVNGRDLSTFEVGASMQLAYDVADNTKLKFGLDLSRDQYEERAVGFIGAGIKF